MRYMLDAENQSTLEAHSEYPHFADISGPVRSEKLTGEYR